MGDDRSADLGNPAARRVVEDVIGAEALAALAERLAGSDLTSLLLEVMTRRASTCSPSAVLRQYERDRFTRPAAVDPRALMSLGARAVDAIGADFDLIEPAPLVPLGTHSVLGGISQNRVVSTVRSTEVAADPTNSLALEAAVRRQALLRRESRSTATVRLAAIERVVRAQRFDGARSFAHFALLGLVSAGRDVGNRQFEVDSMVEHLRALIAVCRTAGFQRVAIRLTDLVGDHADLVSALCDALAGADEVSAAGWPEREAGRNYYQTFCFKLDVEDDGEMIEVADGGMVDWTQALLDNRKERLMISGLSLERLAQVAGVDDRGTDMRARGDVSERPPDRP